MSLALPIGILYVPMAIFYYLSEVFEKIPILQELLLSLTEGIGNIMIFFIFLLSFFKCYPDIEYNCVQKRVLSLIPEL